MSTDRSLFGRVVTFLGLALLLVLGGVIALTLVGKSIPDVLSSLGGAVVAALVGLLVHPPANSDPAPVTVENPPSDPVQVTSPSVEEQAAAFMAGQPRGAGGRFVPRGQLPPRVTPRQSPPA